MLRALAYIVALSALPAGSGATQEGALDPNTIVVVVSLKNPLKDISRKDLRAIFLMRSRHWRTGRSIVVFNAAPKSALRKHFDHTLLGFSPRQSATYWVDFRIRGTGIAPRSVASPRLLRRIVNKHVEAIAYMRAGDAGRGVRILRVDGRAPGDKHYALGRLSQVHR
ncbi:MAG: hypothetical protein JRH20_22800 [Deltaproteobacteria bacterium]|nr:hypothetical protein [Deltaproteobacteria bacterium]